MSSLFSRISPFSKDLLERAVRTAIAAAVGAIATVAATAPRTAEEIKVAFFIVLTTAGTAALGVLTKKVGPNKDSASVIEGNEVDHFPVDEPYDEVPDDPADYGVDDVD